LGDSEEGGVLFCRVRIFLGVIFERRELSLLGFILSGGHRDFLLVIFLNEGRKFPGKVNPLGDLKRGDPKKSSWRGFL